ncbi:MAG: hypothetical protein GC186_15145 [Rhodobacteraceae bacterium]|nr:hypothetical protein [Paracoccaceae bacterium]
MRYLALIAFTSMLAAFGANAQGPKGMRGPQGPASTADQALQQQGFTVMQTVREHNQLRITAHRDNQLRELVYDARTGKLLWDNLDPERDRTRDHLFQQEFDRDRDRLHLRDPSTH